MVEFARPYQVVKTPTDLYTFGLANLTGFSKPVRV